MTEDFGQPKIKYTITRDFSQKVGHQYKVVFYIMGNKKPKATFRICECGANGLLESIKKNLNAIIENKGRGAVPDAKETPSSEDQEHTRYIG
ncbi:MAG: hypothetical protein ISS36_00265 [Candidatus Aenigmarchaeota archaeon]|nr:hypothetical protein [Candidatus Aenigmarchaeota archaeon]